MESFDDVSNVFKRFGLLCELLPFVGRYEYWKFVMKRVNRQSRETWEQYKEAFRQVDSRRAYKIVSYKYNTFDEKFMEYLKNREVCLNYKIKAMIKEGEEYPLKEVTFNDSKKYFIQFLEYCQLNDY